MTSTSEKLAASKAAPRKTLDVTISLNRDLSEEREALVAELEAAKESNDDRMSAPTSAALVQERLDVILDAEVDTLIDLRFTRLPGDEWMKITQKCPPDPENLLDMHYRYSMVDACKLAAKFVAKDGTVYGHVVEDDELVALTVHQKTKSNPDPTDEWEDIFSRISGPEFTTIVDTLYSLNVHGPAERFAELKKRSASLTA